MMSDPERDENELRTLFDRSAEEPDRMQLVKLKARASDVPARAGKRFRFRLWAPLFALAAGALAVFAARSMFEHARPGEGPVASVVDTARAPESAIAAQSSSGTPAAESAEPVTPEDELALGAAEGEIETDTSAELGGIGEDPGDDPLAALDSPADDEIDQWMSATGAYLEGGG